MTESVAAVRRAAVWHAVLRALAVAAVYFLASRLGLLFATQFAVSPFWPPTGVAVAALLVLGLRAWPGVALGAAAVELTVSDPRAAALIVLGDVLAPVVAVAVLRGVRFHRDFRRLRDAASFVLVGVAATVVSASLGTVGLHLVDASAHWRTWFVWWAGDATGVLVVTPVLVLLPAVPRLVRTAGRARLAEWGAALVLTGVVGWLGLLSHGGLQFVVLPAIVWSALRFGVAGAAPSGLLVALLADIAAATRVGEFGDGGVITRMLHLQAFTGVCALTGLLVAGLTTERGRERREAERTLEAAVARRTAELSASVQQLQASEALLAEAQRVGRVGSFEYDIDGGQVHWSAEMSRLWGMPAERRVVTYDEYIAGLHPDDREHVLAVVRDSLRERRPYEFEHRVRWPDGSIRWLHARGRFRTDDDGRPFLFGTSQDITEARAAAEELRRANAEEMATRLESERALLDALEQQRAAAARLREIDRMRKDVVATVSHELRTPLTAITGLLDLLLEDEEDPERRPLLGAAHRSATRLTELVEDLLTMARLDASGPVRREAEEIVDLGAVVREAAASLEQIFARRGQAFGIELPDGGLWPVLGDARQLERAVVNLLSNASKYTPDDGRVRVRLTSTSTSDVVHVAVTDTGVGIPAAEQAKLFDRFFRASTAGDRPGTGLGLSIVKTIVDRHGGRLEVSSEPGAGSTFTVSLPLARVPAAVR